MRKPGFGVVSGVVTVLAILAFIAQMLIGQIPEGPENRLANADSTFLRQAGTEEIDWHPLDENTFAEARKRDLPIMLVVGSACSATGRYVDETTFQSKEIQNFLDRNFICARVDTMQYPQFANAFLPVSRGLDKDGWRLAIPPDYQIWFLDPKGQMFAFAADSIFGRRLEPRNFRPILNDALDRLARIRSGDSAAGEQQRIDEDAVRAPLASSMPDPGAYGDSLAGFISDQGGLPINGFQRLWPSAWRFQLLSGRFQDYLASIEPCLRSPRVDLLDGGFFTNASDFNWRGGGYDKVARLNAEMLRTLSLGAVLMQDPHQRWIAERTFDTLASDFVQRGHIRGGRIGDSNRIGRSERASFSPRDLRELFPNDSQRDWLRQNLGLRVETNQDMTPMLNDLDLPFSQAETFNDSLKVLRTKGEKPGYVGERLLDVGGVSVAALIESARILGDRDRLNRATNLFLGLDEFRSLDDVTHTLSDTEPPHVYLGDYLAYADAALQEFLATGDSQAFDHGIAVLRRALFLYGGEAKGLYTLTQPNPAPLAAQNIASPEIADNFGESCTARLMRLCWNYGRLSGTQGKALLDAARNTRSRFAPIAQSMGPYSGGFFCSSVTMSSDSYAVVSGNNAVEIARSLAARNPLHLIAPAIGSVKSPGKLPGIYVVSTDGVKGPMSLERAAEALSGATP